MFDDKVSSNFSSPLTFSVYDVGRKQLLMQKENPHTHTLTYSAHIEGLTLLELKKKVWMVFCFSRSFLQEKEKCI